MRNQFETFLTQQRGRFVLFLPVFLGAGMLAYFGRATEPSLPWSVGGVVVQGGLAACLWRRPMARAALLCGGFTAAGFALAAFAAWRAPPWEALPRHAVVISGLIAGIDILPDARRVTIATPSLDGAAPLRRALRIRLRAADPAMLAQGDRIALRALVQPPAAPDYPGGWDTQRDAFFAGLDGYGFAIGPARVVHAGGGAWLGRVRDAMAARILRDLPGAPGTIAATLLTGSGSAIAAPDRAAFQQSGLAHLLAVAGLHIGIVMSLAFGATRLALAAWEYAALHWPTRQIAALAALAAGFFYLCLTGAHVPILRSFAMACLVTLGLLTGRRAISLRGLALAACVLLVLAPALVVGVSFQMSFAAVLTLIAGYEMLRPALGMMGQGGQWWRRPAFLLAGVALTSLLAGSAALPFAAYHFGNATLYYLPANMIAVPLTAFWVMPWGLAALALMPLGLGWLALAPMGLGIRALLWIAHGVAGWPGATLAMPYMPPWSLLLIAFGLVWGGLWRGWWRGLGVLPIGVGLVALLLLRPPDVLVGPQARLIALFRAGQVFAESAPGVTAFELQGPARVWGIAAAAPLDGAAGFLCTAQSCRTALRGRIVVVVRGEAERPGCQGDLVLATASLPPGCAGVVYDHARALAQGAADIWLGAGDISVVTDRDVRGSRPWVIGAAPVLPMARTE